MLPHPSAADSGNKTNGSLSDRLPEETDVHMRVDFAVAALLVVFALFWTGRHFLTAPPYVDRERYPIMGIDVSHHNGMMNLNAAAADGVSFIFIKASEGASFRDVNYRINFDKARHAGLKVGAYHFFRFDKEGVEQAKNLLEAIGDRVPDLGIAVDVESHSNPEGIDPEIVAERLLTMTEYLNLKGHRVIFYTNRDGYYDYIREQFEGYPLWISSFSSVPINADWLFWQYNHRGHVKGIRGDVDLNVFCGSREEWEAFSTDTYSAQ